MIRCTACRRDVPDGNTFCIYCGSKMPEVGSPESNQTNNSISSYCASCGKPITVGNLFCVFCGTPVVGGSGNSFSQMPNFVAPNVNGMNNPFPQMPFAGGAGYSYSPTQTVGTPFTGGVNNTFPTMPVFGTSSDGDYNTDVFEDDDEISEENAEVDVFFDEAVNNEMKKMRKWAFFHNHGKLPINIDPNSLRMQRVRDVVVKLRVCGFEKIEVVELKNLSYNEREREGIVERIIVENAVFTYAGQEFSYKSKIKVESNSMRMVFPPVSNKKAKGEEYQKIVQQFRNAGFMCVEERLVPDIGWTGKKKIGKVIQVTVFGDSNYKIAKEYRIDARVVVEYHGPKNKDSDFENELKELEELERLDEEYEDEEYDDDDDDDDEID